MIQSKHKNLHPSVNRILNAETLLKIQQSILQVKLSDQIIDYILNIVFATRQAESIELGVSPRASMALMLLGKATAAVNGRDFVTPDDIKYVAFDVLNHRILLSHEAELDRVNPRDIINSIVETSKVVI
jgi:MoxR-like ATPase